MARSKEACIVLLDVGPQMGDLLEPASKAVSAFIQGKMINKPAHEVELVFFGTTATSNCLHQEMADQGDVDQYKNITEVRPLAPPDVAWLQSLAGVQPGDSSVAADWFNALTVGLDSLARALAPEDDGGRGRELSKAAKRIVLVSDFLGPSEPPGEQFIGHVAGKLREADVLLDVVSIDVPEHDKQGDAHVKNVNSDTLAQVLQEVRHSMRSVQDRVELETAFRLKETAPHTYFSGKLEIGRQMNIGVKVVKKTAAEKAPSLGKWSDRSQAPDASHTVQRDTEYRLVSDPDAVVDNEMRVKAYLYGTQIVPVEDRLEKFLQMPARKGMQLVGFVTNDPDNPAIPRHHYMKDVWCVAPDKADQKSQLAMAALMAAMVRQRDQLAVIRFAPRDTSHPQLFAASPLPAAPGRPACLLLNALPFQEDIRSYPFQSFDSEDQRHKPSQAQRDAMGELLQAMDLSAHTPEALRPETTANPLLRRLYGALAARALDADASVPPPGPIAERLRAPPLDALPARAAEALAALPDAFKITERAAASAEGEGVAAEGLLGRSDGAGFDLEAEAGTAVQVVSTASPVEDFRALIKQGKHETAFQGMPVVIEALVSRSAGDRNYNKALRALEAMRDGAAAHRDFAPAFNDALRGLADKFEHSEHDTWWAQVMAKKVTLVSEVEAPGSGATADDAMAFLRSHTQTSQAASQHVAVARTEEDVDFDSMD